MLQPNATDAAVIAAVIANRLGPTPFMPTVAAAQQVVGSVNWRMVVWVCADAAAHVFIWNAASVAVHDGTTVIRPTAIAVGSPGRWLQDDAAQVIGSAVGGPPTGAAGGDLGGTYPNPSVATVGGSAAATVAGQRAAHEATYAHANLPSAGEKAALAGTSGVPGAANPYVTDGDTRNTNPRVPTAHAASHATAGSDPVSPASIGAPALAHGHSGTTDGSKLVQANTHESPDTDAAAGSLHHTIGTGANQACGGADARLSDKRDPNDHTHAGVGTGGQLVQANTHQSPDTDAAAGSLHHTIGTGATQAAAGNHTHTGTYAPYYHTYVATAISYAVLTTDEIVKATASGITLTLPTAVGVTGKLYRLDNASTGNVTVATTGGQTINGLTTQTVPDDSCMVVYSDGANWRMT